MLRRKPTYILTVLTAAACSFAAAAEERPDTTDLREVVVVAHRPSDDVIPAQTLQGKELEQMNSSSVADALRYFSGVQVKDYGGVGGIKTVNVRSMGTNHTGVSYDGIELGNAQNGQIDLGQFSLDNMESISLHNGQKSSLLQPARDFGSAATIYMRSRSPRFAPGKAYNARLTFRTGSFDLVNPSALAEFRLGRHLNASLSAEWIKSSGRYKFRYKRLAPDGTVAYDTTAVRKNGDINATRLELGLNGDFASGEWHFKAYNYNSERGVPGAIVNNVWRRGERISDNNSFAQGRVIVGIGRFTSLNSIKYAFYRTHYVNNDEKQIKIDNRYRQNELYISTSNEYTVFPWWRVSLSYDLQWNRLKADIYGFAQPDRLSSYLAAATAMNLGTLKLQASLLGTFIHDRVQGKKSPADRKAFTPAIYLSWQPAGKKLPLSLRAFFKRSFRMPTFNDLYYTDVGNASLDPEKVTQYNVGIVFDKTSGGFVSAIRLSADGYINRVKNKIVAYPKGQQFRWTMLNLGKVHITGLDLSAAVTVTPAYWLSSPFDITLRGQYTYQKAIDVTSPSDSYYRDQIPYMPLHSGSAVVNAGWNGWGINYSFIYAGERYSQQENIIYNRMRPWHTSDISLSRDQPIGKAILRIQLEVNNIFNDYYDVILNYPMPGRNWRIVFSAEI